MEYYKNLDLLDIIYVNSEGIECVEQWKDVPEYEGIYQVSDLGRVKSLERIVPSTSNSVRLKKSLIVKQNTCRPYLSVCFYENKKQKYVLVNRLIANSFIKNTENKPQVNHKNGIKYDNRVENLEWTTSKENINHAWNNNLSKSKKGEENHNSKLTAQDVKNIKALKKNYSVIEISKIYNTSIGNIYKILQEKRWKHIQ